MTETGIWAEAIDAYRAHLAAGARRPLTIRLRTHYLGRLSQAFPDPWAVTVDDLTAWLASHRWQAETLRSARSSIAAFYYWAVLTGRIKASPAAALPSIRAPRSLPRPTPDAALTAALGKASGRDRLILLLAARAGLRRAEIASLRWADIEPGALRVRGKGGAERLVPLTPDLARELAAERSRRLAGQVGDGWRYRPDPRSPHVLPGAKGGHMSPETVGALLKQLLGQWGGHTLRHRFATRALRGTRNLRVVQELLGHASVATTQRYTAVTQEELAEAVLAAA